MNPEQISALMEDDAMAQVPPPLDPTKEIYSLVQDAKKSLLQFDSIIQHIDKIAKEQKTNLPDDQKAALHQKMSIITKLIQPVAKGLSEINFQPRSNSILQRLKAQIKPPPLPTRPESRPEIPFAKLA